ncbi:hypothetical protein MBLNU230_g6135t1 [Neophaeotheca triangularis]
MSPKRPPGLKDLLIWSSFILPVVATNALQQQKSHEAYHVHPSADTAAEFFGKNAPDSLSAGHEHHGYRDTFVNNAPSNHQRALATLPSSRDLPARSTLPPAREALAARKLEDWKVEDVVLLATVDGKLHARDRKTGTHRWALEHERPMVETIYHRTNKSANEDGLELEDPLWIVEPSQDGSIYVYAPGVGLGLQKLGFTVKELADMAPYAGDGPIAVAYTAEKRNTLYTVDASNGMILKTFSSGGSTVNNESSCRRVNPLQASDEAECETIGTLTLGRTEYIISVQDRQTGEQISTIKYAEWGPNNRDEDLRREYRSTMDHKYIYTKHDGTVFGLDLKPLTVGKPPNKPAYYAKFGSPVARIYDVVRPHDQLRNDASLVILPQPVGPALDVDDFREDDAYDSIFVNCTPSGTWYALSETKYPTVTDKLAMARLYLDTDIKIPDLWSNMTADDREIFTGVHWLAEAPQPVMAPGVPRIEPPPSDAGVIPLDGRSDVLDPLQNMRPQDGLYSLWYLMIPLVALALAVSAFYQTRLRREHTRAEAKESIVPPKKEVKIELPEPVFEKDEGEPSTPMVRESEPARETIFPQQHELEKIPTLDDGEKEDDELVFVDSKEAEAAVETEANTPKKKKATRGKRGGRKAKEKEAEKAAWQAKKKGESPAPQLAEVISVAASESPQVAGPLQINSLIIHTDKVIGQGSCGTSVFEGSFEGRDVAVKRMLSQYYELASQEVSFLQQSDDHANVIRYFCQQKDDHFLYIAVELCQASLYEVWEAEKARTDERQQQLRLLKFTIQQDIPRTLQQLAAGLHHLHNLRIIHRDIKPQNILVAYPKKHQATGPRLVISDFGLGKNLPENVSTLIDPTGNAGTSGWKAPELISQPRESESRHSQSVNGSHTGGSEPGGPSGVKRAADIFSLGCLFFWVLTDGIHPFEDDNGWTQLRELNIKRDNKKMGVLERWSDAYEPMSLITSMLEHQPENRPTALQVLNHPFFWTPEKRLSFLCDVSDHFEREPRSLDGHYPHPSAQLNALEDRAYEVIGIEDASRDGGFLDKLDRHFVETLGKQRKYTGDRLLDLLRALRNKKNHYEDMPEGVKKIVGPLAGGYLMFWTSRFPRLLMACYEVVHECEVQGNDRFRGYFAT